MCIIGDMYNRGCLLGFLYYSVLFNWGMFEGLCVIEAVYYRDVYYRSVYYRGVY